MANEADADPQADAPEGAATASADPADIAGLTYEQARDELVDIVARLENGQSGLEESMGLWQRGEALAEGLAPRIRADLEETLKRKPDHAGAMVALALWHFELVQKGWLVAATQGADRARVEPLMRRAIELEPEAIVHRVEYARVLAAWGRKEEARKQLETALALPARTAADRYEKERAQKALAELR